MEPVTVFFKNGSTLLFTPLTRVDPLNLQTDFQEYLKGSKQPAQLVKSYSGTVEGKKVFLTMNFDNIMAISIPDDGARPA